MKINLGGVLKVALKIYKAVLSGKTVKVGGHDITLPSQGNVPPLRGSQFDSKPHVAGPVR